MFVLPSLFHMHQAGWPAKCEWCCSRKLNGFTSCCSPYRRGQQDMWKQLRGEETLSSWEFEWQRCSVCSDRFLLKRRSSIHQTHQFFGFCQRVLHIGEAEAGHRDELAHYRYKLVTKILWSFLLVFQLLEAEMHKRHLKNVMVGTCNLKQYKKNMNCQINFDSRSQHFLSHCVGFRYLFPAPSCCIERGKVPYCLQNERTVFKNTTRKLTADGRDF